jgi:hypothetical protein
VARASNLQRVSAHPFLSPEWIEAARAIRADFADRIPDPDVPLRANVRINDAPFDDPEIEGYLDTSDGTVLLELGALDDPELTVSTDYATARALFVARDPGKIMEAFMLGKVLITGDVTRILSLTPPTDPEQLALGNEVASRLAAITAE